MNKSLVTLNLDFNSGIGSNGGIKALCIGLRTNSTLKKLSLRHCSIIGRGMDFLFCVIIDLATFIKMQLKNYYSNHS